MLRRFVSLLVLLAVGAGVAGVLFSDRLPRLFSRTVDRVLDVAGEVRDRIGLADLVGRDDIPFEATFGAHIALFAALTVVAGVVLRRRARPWLVAAVTFAASAAFEVLQPLVTDSRQQQVSDLQANAIGVVAGFVVLSLVLRIRRLRRSRSLAW